MFLSRRVLIVLGGQFWARGQGTPRPPSLGQGQEATWPGDSDPALQAESTVSPAFGTTWRLQREPQVAERPEGQHSRLSPCDFSLGKYSGDIYVLRRR
jgi:hypothetical protein